MSGGLVNPKGISTGTYLGISLVETLIREQQRQAYLQQQLRTQQELGRDQAAIAQLQAELAAQNSKVQTAPAWSHLGPSRATSGTGHLGPSLASLACQLWCTSRATSLVLQASAPSRPYLGESRAISANLG